MSYAATAARARAALQTKAATTTLRRITNTVNSVGKVTGSSTETWPIYALMVPVPSRVIKDRTVPSGKFYLAFPAGSTCVPQMGDEIFYLDKWWELPSAPTPLAPDGVTVILYDCELEI
jgi:hypothetical protein